MTYELIQAALTNLITFTAIAGFGGCVIHYFYTSHKRWMAEYCPPIAPVAAPEETDEDNSTSKYFELEKEETVQSEIELSALDSTILRNLCTQHGITWKNVRGKGKHLTKAAMIFQLQRVTA